jgi:hypothetical protein
MQRIKINLQHKSQFNKKGILTKNLIKINSELLEIENEFLEAWLDTENQKTYQELFAVYSVRYYLKAHEWQKRTGFIIDVNVDYFAQQYNSKK